MSILLDNVSTLALCAMMIILVCLVLFIACKAIFDDFICKHDWKFEREVKERVDNNDKYPTHIYKIYQCSKCKKIKKVKVI